MLRELLIAFLRNPASGSFKVLRDEVLAQEAFDPRDDSLDGVSALLEAGQYAEGAALIRAHLAPNYLLSPGAHWALGYALKMLGEEKAEKFEFSVGQQVLNGMLLCGEGTEESPIPVLRVSDQYDYLLHAGLRLAEQSVVRREGRVLERMVMVDGAVVWFDVTDMMAVCARRLGGV